MRLGNQCNHLIVTGGSGYIGSRLISIALSKGMQVTMLGRLSSGFVGANKALKFIKWELGMKLPIEELPIDYNPSSAALIHLAHDWNGVLSDGDDLNLRATQALFSSAQSFGISRIIFASSQSARFDAPNRYGRIKWRIEQAVEADNIASARIGLVYGRGGKGMYGLLLKLVQLPILPMVSPNTLVQPIHVDEVCTSLIDIVNSDISGTVPLASRTPIPFSTFLKQVAKIEFGKNLFILPINIKLALLGCGVTKFIPYMPTVDKERILGLTGTIPMETSYIQNKLDLKILDFKVPRFSSSSTGYRGLLVEGNTILRYCMDSKPSKSILREYINGALASTDNFSRPIGLSPIAIRWPFLLRLYEPIKFDDEIGSRIRLGLAVGSGFIWNKYFKRERSNKILRTVFLILMFLWDFLFLVSRYIFTKIFK